MEKIMKKATVKRSSKKHRPFNRQRAFNIVWDWFITQGHRPSVDEDEGCCRLRSLDGARCSIGVLIPNKSYSEKMEGVSVGSPLIRKAFYSNLGKAAPFDGGFLSDLEDLHDDCVWVGGEEETKRCTTKQFRKSFRASLVTFAESWGLSVFEAMAKATKAGARKR